MLRRGSEEAMEEWRNDGSSPAGARGMFKTTRWTRVHKACQEDSPSGRQALAGLGQDYGPLSLAFAVLPCVNEASACHGL